MATKLVDFILEEDYERYNELLNMAEEAKKNAPKEKKPRAPMSKETKLKIAQAKRDKAQAALDALLASEAEA